MKASHQHYYCKPCWEMLQGQKKCTECREIKPIEEFAEDKSRPDGHEYYCRTCRKDHQLQRYAKEIIRKGTKRCFACKKNKALSDFFEDRRTRDGVSPQCKDCINGIKADKSKINATREYNKCIISSRKARRLKYDYGMSRDEYIQLFEKQKGLCAICQRPELNSISPILTVDHDHKTGKVRGLLCSNCNTGIGLLEECREYLLNAINYLKQHE